jgi:membrane protein implicated in regulation of membrane protease activity
MGGTMRCLQIVLFFLGLALLLAAAFFVGAVAGDALWRAGVALLLVDVVCILLWPRSASKTDIAG